MTHHGIRRLVVAIAALSATTIGLTVPAHAAEPVFKFRGSAGGTFVNVLGGAVRSDLTAGSYLSGTAYPSSTSNTTLAVDIPGLASIDAIETSGTAENPDPSINSTTMRARVAGVSLLDGLITARALDTTTTANRRGDQLSGQSSTDLIGLSVAGQDLPLRLPRNTKITVPGIAEVTINQSDTDLDSGNVVVTGSALKVRLLRAIDSSPVGTVVTINPTVAALERAQPTDVTRVGGYAYVTTANAKALAAGAQSGPTSAISCPDTGTNGRTNMVSLARVTLPGLLEAGAVETTSTATSVPVTADVTHTAEAARVNLLNGLVTADAVKVTATVRKLPDGTVVREPSTRIVGLRLAGLPVRLDVPRPNLKLSIPGVLTVAINEQDVDPTGVTVTGLRVRLLNPVGGLGTGAEVKVGVASSSVY